MANPAENNVKNESPAQENKMGVMPVGKLLFTMSLPIMISMLVQALYNVVDSMFVARVSENALTALSMAFPIQNLMIAVSTGLGVGLNAVLSRALGAKDEKGVNRAATNGIMLLFICGLVFMLGGATIVRPYFEMQTDIAEIVESGVDYTTIVMLGSMGIFMQILFERLLQSTGRTLLTMVSQGVGAIANIILDPIFIFGLFGVPKMGVAGAAAATVLSQVVSAVLVMMTLCRSPQVYRVQLKKIRFYGDMLVRIVRIGLPAGLQSVMYSLSNIIIQASVNGFGTDVMAAYTAYGKVDGMYWMVINAFGVAITTFVGQNFGARLYDRMKKSINVCLGIAAAVTLLLSGVLMVVAEPLLGLFSDDAQVLEIGLSIVRLIVPTYITYIFIEILSGAMRGAGDSLIPTIMTLTGVCLLRVFWVTVVVSAHHELNVLLLSYPITWIVTSGMFVVYYLRGRWLKRCIALQNAEK